MRASICVVPRLNEQKLVIRRFAAGLEVRRPTDRTIPRRLLRICHSAARRSPPMALATIAKALRQLTGHAHAGVEGAKQVQLRSRRSCSPILKRC